VKQNPPWRYRFGILLLLPLIVAHLFYRTAKDGGWRYLKERLGFTKPAPFHELHVHAASVGEVITALPLLNEIQRRNTHQRLLITTNTPTGADILHRRMPVRARHAYMPLDFSVTTKRFFKTQKYSESWIIETEIWPWFYSSCHLNGVKVTIVSGRLSHRSRGSVSNFFHLAYQRALHGVQVLARSEADANNFIDRGAQAHRVSVLGNLKWVSTPVNTDEYQLLLPHSYVLAASTHDDEETQLADAWLSSVDSGLMVIAPRHPERGARLQGQLLRIQLANDINLPPPPRRSLDEPVSDETRLYIADTLGELPHWYAGASATFIGGSLVAHGGHNVLEAARAITPIATGPYTDNFEHEVNLLIDARGISVIDNASDAIAFLLRASTDLSWSKSCTHNASTALNKLDTVLDDYCHHLLKVDSNAR